VVRRPQSEQHSDEEHVHRVPIHDWPLRLRSFHFPHMSPCSTYSLPLMRIATPDEIRTQYCLPSQAVSAFAVSLHETEEGKGGGGGGGH